MPEGDTLFRTAAGLRPYLVGRPVRAARATGGAQVGRLVGATVDSVDTIGKNLLMRFSNGLEVRTHLRMNGTWHRYRPGERWRRPAARAVLVLEVDGAVAVCFDAPVVELFEARAEALHPALAPLGPDLLGAAVRRGRGAPAAARPVAGRGDDRGGAPRPAGHGRRGQRLSREILFIERVDPFAPRRLARRRDPRAPRRDGPAAAARQRRAAPRPRALDDRGRPRGRRRAAVGLRPGRPALPPLWDRDPLGQSRPRAAADRLVVPVLSADGGRPGVAVSSGLVCEHFVARSAEPFRIDELWGFTEKLERFGIAGFGWGAAWRTADGRLETYRDVRAFRDDPARERIGATETRSLLVHLRRPVAAVHPRRARHAAVPGPGRPVRVQPQRRPRRPTSRGASAYRAEGRIHGKADSEVGQRWLEDAWSTASRPGQLLGALHDVFGGEANFALLEADGAVHTTRATAENPVFTFRLGAIRLASTGHLLARPLAVPVRRARRHRPPTRPARARRSRLD